MHADVVVFASKYSHIVGLSVVAPHFSSPAPSNKQTRRAKQMLGFDGWLIKSVSEFTARTTVGRFSVSALDVVGGLFRLGVRATILCT